MRSAQNGANRLDDLTANSTDTTEYWIDYELNERKLGGGGKAILLLGVENHSECRKYLVGDLP